MYRWLRFRRALNASGGGKDTRVKFPEFSETFPDFTASKRAVGGKDLQMAQVLGDAPALAVEPNGPRAQHEVVLVVAATNRGLFRRLLASVPKLDVRVAALALEVLGALVADFERALERRAHDVGCQGFHEVLLSLFSDLRPDLGFELQNEGYQLGRRPEAEVQRIGVDVVGLWLPGHGCLHRGFPFYVLPVPLEGGAAGLVGGGFEFADGGRHGFLVLVLLGGGPLSAGGSEQASLDLRGPARSPGRRGADAVGSDGSCAYALVGMDPNHRGVLFPIPARWSVASGGGKFFDCASFSDILVAC